MASTIGGIVVGITGDIRDLNAKLGEAGKSIGKFGDQMKDLGKEVSNAGKEMTRLVTVPIAALVTGIVAATVKVGNWADEIQDLHSKTGMATDSIQEWAYACRVAGQAPDTVTTAIEGLIRRLPSLEEESGASAEALAKLGLTFQDLKAMSPDEVAEALIMRLSEMTDVMDRNAVASKLFGLGWKELAPILDEGADGIKALRKESHELGVVMSDEGLEAADDFRAAWVKVKEQFAAVFRELGRNLMPLVQDTFLPLLRDRIIPVFKSIVEFLGSIVQAFSRLPAPVRDAVVVLGALLAAVGPVTFAVGQVIKAVGLFGSALSLLAAHPFIAACAAIVAAIVLILDSLGILDETWNAVWNGLVFVVQHVADAIILVMNSVVMAINLPIDALNLLIKAYNLIPGLPDLGLIPKFQQLGYVIDDTKEKLTDLSKVVPVMEKAFSDLALSAVENLTDVQGAIGTLNDDLTLTIEMFPDLKKGFGEVATAWSAAFPKKEAGESFSDFFSGLREQTAEMKALAENVFKVVAAYRAALAGNGDLYKAMMAVKAAYDDLAGRQETWLELTGHQDSDLAQLQARLRSTGLSLEDLEDKTKGLTNAMGEGISAAEIMAVAYKGATVSAGQLIISEDELLEMAGQLAVSVEDMRSALEQLGFTYKGVTTDTRVLSISQAELITKAEQNATTVEELLSQMAQLGVTFRGGAEAVKTLTLSEAEFQERAEAAGMTTEELRSQMEQLGISVKGASTRSYELVKTMTDIERIAPVIEKVKGAWEKWADSILTREERIVGVFRGISEGVRQAARDVMEGIGQMILSLKGLDDATQEHTGNLKKIEDDYSAGLISADEARNRTREANQLAHDRRIEDINTRHAQALAGVAWDDWEARATIERNYQNALADEAVTWARANEDTQRAYTSAMQEESAKRDQAIKDETAAYEEAKVTWPKIFGQAFTDIGTAIKDSLIDQAAQWVVDQFITMVTGVKIQMGLATAAVETGVAGMNSAMAAFNLGLFGAILAAAAIASDIFLGTNIVGDLGDWIGSLLGEERRGSGTWKLVDGHWVPVTGYQSGGIVAGALGEPQLAVVHGGETINPPGGSYGFDYARMGEAVAAGVYDALSELQARGGGTQIILEVDGNRMARALYPGLLYEGQRRGTVIVPA